MKAKQILRQHDFRPKKSWGQNFLISDKARDKIIEAAEIAPADTLIEIGPGLGVLTGSLVKCSRNVIAIERDERLCRILKELLAGVKNLQIVCRDILKIDLPDLTRCRSINSAKEPVSNRVKVVGNLPYYITTPIIFHLLKFRKIIDLILITVQKEVGRRILAVPGTRDYSSLSVAIKFYCQPELVGIIKKGSFYPRPKVDSSIIKMNVLNQPSAGVNDEEKFFKLVRTSFNKRRKTVLNALAGLDYFGMNKNEWLVIFEKAGLDPGRRAETFSVAEYAKLSNLV